MELTIYDVIQGPVVSDKAYRLNQQLKKLVLYVHPHANKPLVSEAIEKLFDVKVASVRIVVRKGKWRRTRVRTKTQGKLTKRAYVTLKSGYDVNLFGDVAAHAQANAAQSSNQTVKDN